jgi:hypothetical protein
LSNWHSTARGATLAVALGMWRLSRARTGLALGAVAAGSVIFWLTSGNPEHEGKPVSPVEAADPDESTDQPLREDKREVSDSERAELLARARIWRQPRVAVSRASLEGHTLEEVSCRFDLSEPGGTTPKFDCILENGDEVRIKYGNGPEVPAEAAATRLLRALGFPADDVTLVRRLRCYGCPEEPFSTMKAVGITQAEPLYEKLVDYSDYEDFEWVAMEQKFNARPVETDTTEGWSFFELDTIEPARGGAPRTHVDALRIIAVLLAHWDNKAENQRLVCLTPDWAEGTPCPSPLLLLQDVGATFGPPKLDLAAWEKAPMWEDRATCTLSMRELPFEGATFGQVHVTDEGRRFIAGLLSQLSDQQLTQLFTHARFAEKRGLFNTSSPVSEWVRVFKAKVRAISDGPACPA